MLSRQKCTFEMICARLNGKEEVVHMNTTLHLFVGILRNQLTHFVLVQLLTGDRHFRIRLPWKLALKMFGFRASTTCCMETSLHRVQHQFGETYSFCSQHCYLCPPVGQVHRVLSLRCRVSIMYCDVKLDIIVGTFPTRHLRISPCAAASCKASFAPSRNIHML